MAAMVALIFIDFDHQILPNSITLPGMAVALALAGPRLDVSVRDALLGALLGAGLLLLVSEVYFRLRKMEGLGMGDVKMMGMVGAFVGWKGVLLTLFLGSLSGTLAGLVVMASSKGRPADEASVRDLSRYGRHRDGVRGRTFDRLVPKSVLKRHAFQRRPSAAFPRLPRARAGVGQQPEPSGLLGIASASDRELRGKFREPCASRRRRAPAGERSAAGIGASHGLPLRLPSRLERAGFSREGRVRRRGAKRSIAWIAPAACASSKKVGRRPGSPIPTTSRRRRRRAISHSAPGGDDAVSQTRAEGRSRSSRESRKRTEVFEGRSSIRSRR